MTDSSKHLISHSSHVGRKNRQLIQKFEENVRRNKSTQNKVSKDGYPLQVGRINNISRYEKEALQYEKYLKEQAILRQNRKDRINTLLRNSVRNVHCFLNVSIFFLFVDR